MLMASCSAQKPGAASEITEEIPKEDVLTAKNGEYTLAWISDPQHYSAKFPETYYAMTEFLAENRERINIKYIIHTGDLVNNKDIDEEWQRAIKAQEAISGIPNGVLAGNHDVGNSDEDYSVFSKHFGADRYSSSTWYGGTYKDNRGHYDLIDVGDTAYIFVYMGYAPDDDCIKWLNKVFALYPDRIGVLCLHDYFKTDGELSETGEVIYKKVVKKNPNLYMVLCGHRYRIDSRDSSFDDDGDGTPDRVVHEVICNYQTAGAEGGDGYMRFMKVDEKNGVIRMYSYSPTKDDYTYFDTEEHRAETYSSDPLKEEYTISIPWL